MPNFSVKNAQLIYPAADLSEQISTAGKEASGTGNMKFMINGALTIGTLDGANVEMRDEVGAENFFLFGLTDSEVEKVRPTVTVLPTTSTATTNCARCWISLPAGRSRTADTEVFKSLAGQPALRRPVPGVRRLRGLPGRQEQVSAAWLDKDAWTKMSILNTARSGKFSSDRAIAEYCDEIWNVWPLSVTM